MKIKIIKECRIPDVPGAGKFGELQPGQIVDVNSEHADRFVNTGFAVIAQPAEDGVSLEVIENRDPEVEARDPMGKPPRKSAARTVPKSDA